MATTGPPAAPDPRGAGPADAHSPISPLIAAQIIARNIVPLAGVLFLHWQATTIVLLYLLDTLLAIAVLMAGLGTFLSRSQGKAGGAPVGPVRAFAAAVVVTAFLAVPLGVPVLIALAANGVSWRSVLADPGLRMGALMQTAAAVWSCIGFARALRSATPEQLRVKRRFALIFLRWVGVLMVIFSGAGVFLPILVIVAYVAISIWEEIAPDHFLAAAGDREPAARGADHVTQAPAPPRTARPRKSRRRRG